MTPEFELWYTAVLLVLMSILLVVEIVQIELVMFTVLLLLIVGDVITVKEAFSGFSNEGMLTIGLLFILAGALNNTGLLHRMVEFLFGRGNGGIARRLLRILFPVAAVSAFMNNTPVVAMLIPPLRRWAEKYGHSVSRYLLPVSYAAILGGLCTLIGTSTNLIVHGLMLDHGMPGLGMFEISRIGVPVAVVGVLFIALIGVRLLPERKEPLAELGETTREYVIELKVTRAYEHIGKTIEEAGLRHLKGLFLFQIERDGEIIAPAGPDERIRVGDRLFFTGLPRTILELQKTPGLQLTKDTHFDLKHYDSDKIRTFECVISPGSPLVGKNVRESNFRQIYGAVIIAIHRHGERIRKKIGDIVLRPGDTLLLLADRNFRNRWYHSGDFYLIAGADTIPSKPPGQVYLTVGVFGAMIAVVVLGILPLLAAAGLGVVILMVTRCISGMQARELIDWRVLVVIALSLGISVAVERSGLAGAVGQVIVNTGGGLGSMGALALVYALTALYTSFITNNAAAAFLFPIALSVAATLGMDPRAFAITVLVAAGASFATPISYQTNLMVYGPGGYRFVDFLKIGLPLQILTGVVALALIGYFYL